MREVKGVAGGRQGLYHQRTYLNSLDLHMESCGELPRNLRRGLGAMVSFHLLINDWWSFENGYEREVRPDGGDPTGCELLIFEEL